MSDTDPSVRKLEEQLAGLEQTFSGVQALSELQVARVAERMDRLASRLMELSAPPSMAAAHQAMGTRPASAEDFAGLVGQMAAPDGEG